MSMPTETMPEPTVFPSPPRSVTPRVSRRSWAESPVRFWWTSAALVGLVALVVGWMHVSNDWQTRHLMTTGTPVKAVIIEVRGTPRPGYSQPRDDNVPVKLSAELPDGSQITLTGMLSPAPPPQPPPVEKRDHAKVGAILPIRIDPTNTENWAEEIVPQPWWRVVAVPMLMLLPLSMVLLGVAQWRRRNVLRVWHDGIESRGIVNEVKHSAVAPRSRVVSFSLTDEADRRVFKTLYPVRAGIPQSGDTLNLLIPPGRPQEAIVADLYIEQPPAT